MPQELKIDFQKEIALLTKTGRFTTKVAHNFIVYTGGLFAYKKGMPDSQFYKGRLDIIPGIGKLTALKLELFILSLKY